MRCIYIIVVFVGLIRIYKEVLVPFFIWQKWWCVLFFLGALEVIDKDHTNETQEDR